jgi:hypothetical protein
MTSATEPADATYYREAAWKWFAGLSSTTIEPHPYVFSSFCGHRPCGSRAHHAYTLLFTYLHAYVSCCVIVIVLVERGVPCTQLAHSLTCIRLSLCCGPPFPLFFSDLLRIYELVFLITHFFFNHLCTCSHAHLSTCPLFGHVLTRLFTHSRVFSRAHMLVDARYVLAALGGCLTVMWEVLFPVQQARGQDQVARSVRAFWHRNLSRFPLPEEVRFPLM